MKILKKSTATTVLLGPFVDDTDGKTAETGLTIARADVLLWKEGGTTLAQKTEATSCTHRSNGYYTCPLDTTDTGTNGILEICVSKSGALPVRHTFYVVHANTFDGMISYSGLGSLANVVGWNTSAIASPDTAGYPKVTIKSGSGTGEISLLSGGVSLTSSERAAVADAVFDEDITTHRTANSAGAMFQPLHSGACQAGGSTTTVVLASGASSTDDYYNGDLLVGWVTADGTNKFADYISDYVGSTRTATVTGIPVSPGATYSYVVLPGGTIPGASAPSASDNAAAVWNALTASYTAAGSFGERFTVVRRNTLGATGTSSALTLDSGASTTADYYRYATIQMLSGACAGQSRQITAYSTGRVATVDPAFTTAPSSGDAFLILPLGIDATTVATIVAGVWSALRADYNSAGTFGEYTNADVLRIAGNTTSAGNLNNALNGTGYTFANCTVPAVTTVTTLTGHTPQTGDTYARLGAPAGASVSADIAAIVADTNELQTDWANGGRLDVILDARASQTTADAILADTGTDGVVVAGLTAGAKAEVNAEVVDVLVTDTFAQPSSVPAATSSIKDKINWMFTVLRNKITQTATTQTLRNDADTTTIGTSTHSDNGTTHTRGKWS